MSEMLPLHRILLVPALAAVTAAGICACRYDPVPQEIIDGLGEEKGEPSATHRPGQPCLACHSTYEGADPPMAVGGTVYTRAEDGSAVAASNLLVTLFDSAGASKKACTNGAGNFYIEKEKWQDVTFPLAVTAGDRSMRSLIGRDGSCAGCHFISPDKDHDPMTGAGRDTPGLVIVTGPGSDTSCGGAP